MNDVLTLDELRALPATTDLPTAARALGLGRTKAYELAKTNRFPCRILRIGGTYRIPTADLLRYLGLSLPATGPQVNQASPSPGRPGKDAAQHDSRPSSVSRPSGQAEHLAVGRVRRGHWNPPGPST
jgi:excisionase family DNA binding protein